MEISKSSSVLLGLFLEKEPSEGCEFFWMPQF